VDETGGASSNYMLETAPLPPPVTKAAPQQSNFSQGEQMDVEMTASA